MSYGIQENEIISLKTERRETEQPQRILLGKSGMGETESEHTCLVGVNDIMFTLPPLRVSLFRMGRQVAPYESCFCIYSIPQVRKNPYSLRMF
jgi:hypothetical protein